MRDADDEAGIRRELAACAPLLPDGGNRKSTMLPAYPDVDQRRREPPRLVGIDDRMFVEVEGRPRVYAVADDDLDHGNDVRMSALHFLRFDVEPAAYSAVSAGASVRLGCDPPHHRARVVIAAAMLPNLAGDRC